MLPISLVFTDFVGFFFWVVASSHMDLKYRMLCWCLHVDFAPEICLYAFAAKHLPTDSRFFRLAFIRSRKEGSRWSALLLLLIIAGFHLPQADVIEQQTTCNGAAALPSITQRRERP